MVKAYDLRERRICSTGSRRRFSYFNYLTAIQKVKKEEREITRRHQTKRALGILSHYRIFSHINPSSFGLLSKFVELFDRFISECSSISDGNEGGET